MTSLMAATRASSATSTATGVLSVLGLGGFEVAKCRSRGTRGWCWRRAHAHVRHCRLITAMCM